MNTEKMAAVRSAALDLSNVLDSPESAAFAFRVLADKFNESAGELAAAWQDKHAGKIWASLARTLDSMAAKAER